MAGKVPSRREAKKPPKSKKTKATARVVLGAAAASRGGDQAQAEAADGEEDAE